MVTEFFIGNSKIGLDHPCFMIAEIGSNHNNDFNQAIKLIDAAAESGVNAVKFQTFRAKDHYSQKAPKFNYLSKYDTFELIKQLEIDRSWHKPLKEYSESLGLVFLSSACDIDAICELDQLGMSAFKVASFDLPDLQLIRQMAKTGKPLILSTGMSDWMDIQRALDVVHSVDNYSVALLQCTSLYPAPINLSNLKSMSIMRRSFNVVTGYSDHTMGDHVCLAAVAMGASIIEKHFTLDRSLSGPDHKFAIEPHELKVMVKKIREIESAIGDGVKNGPRTEENEMYEKGRRSLHVNCNISKGKKIEASMLDIKRPGLGISPFLIDEVIGRYANCDIEQDQWLTWDMI